MNPPENPFPGMNPYMENPRLWRMVHHRLLSAIDDELAVSLPEEYVARIDERVYVEGYDRNYIPGNAVIQTRAERGNASVPVRGGTGTAVLERPAAAPAFDPPRRLRTSSLTLHEPFLEIRTHDENEEIVAVIEVLSTTNKTFGAGREDYQKKQRDLLRSWTHFVEIDLLRAGQYTVAPPEAQIREETVSFDYLISLHWGGRDAFDVWPVHLREKLPCIRIPLTQEQDGVYVVLDMQAIVNRAYREGSTSRNIRYDVPLSPPVSSADALWIEKVLAEHGLRPQEARHENA